MNNLTITLEGSVPHYEKDGSAMNMIHYRTSIEATQDEGQSKEELEKEAHIFFQKQMDYIGGLSPIVKQKQEKFQRILNEFKKEVPETYNKIISNFK